MTKDNVKRAACAADLLVADLQYALKTATPLEGMVILDQIEAAAKLLTRLRQIAEMMS